MGFKEVLDELKRYDLIDAEIDKAGNVNSITVGIKGRPATYSKFNKEETEELEDIMTNLGAGVMDFNIFPNKYTKIDAAEGDSLDLNDLNLDCGLYEQVKIMRAPKSRHGK